MRVGNDPSMGAAGGAGARGFGAPAYAPPPPTVTPGAPGTPDQPPAFDPTKDPATGEDMSNDTRVTIRMAVILDPMKPGDAAQPPPDPNNP